MLYFAAFIAALGFFLGEKRILAFGLVLVGASFFINGPDPLSAIGFDTEVIRDGMSGTAD